MIETNGKFVIFVSGIAVKYRLEIIKNACPKSKDYLIFFTDKFSYDLYYDYHDYFQFVLIDDYRKNYEISIVYELLTNFRTEEEYFANINRFYNNKINIFYPYEIHRFAFLYLMENNILNFAIVDTDFIITNIPENIKAMFDSVKPGTIYGPWHGKDESGIQHKLDIWERNIQPNFPEITLKSPFLRTFDGFVRGFNFRNLDDMNLLFRIWNNMIEYLFVNREDNGGVVGNNGLFYHAEWVISHIAQFFEYQKNYIFADSNNVFFVNNRNIGIHKTRPEDTLAIGYRECWKHFNFDYSDISTISNFIKNNKEQLNEYYKQHFQYFEITDNYVFTRID